MKTIQKQKLQSRETARKRLSTEIKQILKNPNQQEVKFADEDISPIQHAPREIRGQREDFENLGTEGLDSLAQTT